MASYETHRNVGLGVGVLVAGLCMAYSTLVSILVGYIPLYTFLAVVAGSIIPDVEAGRKSKPNEMAFFLLSIFGAYYSLRLLTSDYPIALVQKLEQVLPQEAVTVLPVLVFGLIFFALRALFAKVIHHRGAFHSCPAVLVVFLLVFILLRARAFQFNLAIRYAMDFSIGYYAHLLADEINSLCPGKKKVAIDCDGNDWNPKDSLGSAIDLNFPVGYRKQDGAFGLDFSLKENAGRWVGFVIMYGGIAALYLLVARAELEPWIIANAFAVSCTLGGMVVLSTIVNLIHQADMRKTHG